MPFTVSHVAAVLPLRGRWRLPLAPLVLGSMAPDVWLFLGLPRVRDLAHTATGVVTVDLLVVLVAGAAWHHVLRAPVADLLPSLSARWARPVPGGPAVPWAGRWLLAALIGVLTHVVWDEFTHDDGWAVLNLAPLQESVLGLSVAMWLQYACSALGLIVLAAFVLRWWRTTPAGTPVAAGLIAGRARAAAWGVLALAAATGGGYRAADPVATVLGLSGRPAQVGPWRLRVLVTDLLLGAGIGVAVAVLLLALGWHAAHLAARRREQPVARPQAQPSGRVGRGDRQA